MLYFSNTSKVYVRHALIFTKNIEHVFYICRTHVQDYSEKNTRTRQNTGYWPIISDGHEVWLIVTTPFDSNSDHNRL
jgi:hypothetical protein